MSYKYDVFGTRMCIKKIEGEWKLFKISSTGLLSHVKDVVIPTEMMPEEFKSYLDDIYHEYASDKHPAVIELG